MWAISPKWEEWELVDADLNGEDGWCCMWDTTMVNDGVYTLLVETMDVNGFVGRASIVVEVDNYLDNTPPTTTIIFDGPYDWDPERDGWIISPDTYIGFSADDGDGVGVNATYLRHWHNGIWSPDWMIIEEDFNFTLPCLGLHYLEFYSVDYVGNTEEVNNVTIYVEEENHPPNTPTQPSGPTSGSVGESLHYESYFNDPDGDSMNIRWDWGDGTPTDWYGVITSGTTVGAYHSWDELGTYQVRTKARDIPHHAESGWSPPLTVTIN